MPRPNQSEPTCAALIPARSGSRRVPGKNVRVLAGHPIIAYTIAAARDSGVFDRVLVSTDSEAIAEIAREYGAEVPFLRPSELAGDTAPDIGWVRHALAYLLEHGGAPDVFSILRPTSPFRSADTIRRAWSAFLGDGRADSLRAVELCNEHPAKMWFIDGDRMRPVLENPDRDATPWHSQPYQALPRVFVQNASLEIARSDVALRQGSIAGREILPFVTSGLEGFDINSPDDWIVAEHHAREDPGALPTVSTAE